MEPDELKRRTNEHADYLSELLTRIEEQRIDIRKGKKELQKTKNSIEMNSIRSDQGEVES